MADVMESLAENKKHAQLRVKPQDPKLTAADPAVLRRELRQLRTYMYDCRHASKKDWFHVARTVCNGRARTWIEAFVVEVFKNEAGYQDARASADEKLWSDT